MKANIRIGTQAFFNESIDNVCGKNKKMRRFSVRFKHCAMNR